MSDTFWPIGTTTSADGERFRILACQACGASVWCLSQNGNIDRTAADRHESWHRGTRATTDEAIPSTMLVPGQRYRVDFSCADGNFGGQIVDTLVSVGDWDLVFEHAAIGPADGVTIRAVPPQ